MVRRFSKKTSRKRKFGERSERRNKRKSLKRSFGKQTSGKQKGCSISNNKVIEWILDKKHVTNLYKYLYDNIEHGGKFPLSTKTKKSSHSVKSNTGEKDSVDAPDAIVNWHTHPISCYLGEQTVWGWPSGEDMRETLIFGLRGSACHVVPSVEGVYVIQPNPCVVTSLINIQDTVSKKSFDKISKLVPGKKWGDFLRGIIILAIEIYFRSTHIFRTADYVKYYPNTTAHDFVNFTNVFQLTNIFSEAKIEGCSEKMSCNQIQQFENKRVKNMTFKKYVKTYESDAYVYFIDEKGDSEMTNIKFSDILDKGAISLLRTLALGNDCFFPIKKWHTGRVFLMTLYRNKVRHNNTMKFYDTLSNKQKLDFLNKYQNGPKNSIEIGPKQIKFYLFDMKGNCNHTSLVKHINNFSKSKKAKKANNNFGSGKGIEVIGDVSCKFCRMAKDRAKEKGVDAKFYFDFGSINGAIQAASQKAEMQINSIPAYFVGGVYQNIPPF